MEIELTRELKLTLLRWLKQGYIDKMELVTLQSENEMTMDEALAELERLERLRYSGVDECGRCRRLGLCKYENELRKLESR